jgi:hypothetical protein
MTKYTREQTVAAFWSKVDVGGPDECWEWKASLGADGYGTFGWNGKTTRSHRLAFFLSGRLLAEGKSVCHSCDNPPCCNPKHLFQGSNQDNVDDRHRKGRSFNGPHPWKAVLTRDQVISLRRDMESGLNWTELGVKYGISRQAATKIGKGEVWKHI